MSTTKTNPQTHYPCGKLKPQPVKLKENVEHYRACNDEQCRARLRAFEELKQQLTNQVKR